MFSGWFLEPPQLVPRSKIVELFLRRSQLSFQCRANDRLAFAVTPPCVALRCFVLLCVVLHCVFAALHCFVLLCMALC